MIYVLEWVSSMRESVVNIRWMYDICPWMGVEYEGECGKYQVNVWYMSLNGCRVWGTHSRTNIIHSPYIYHTPPHTRHLFKDIYHTFTWYLPHPPSYSTPIQGHISYIHLIFTTLSFILDTYSRTYIIHSPDIYHTLPHTWHPFKDIYHTFTWYLPHSPSYSTPIQGHISYIHLIFTTLSLILDTHSRTYIIHSPDIYHTLLHTRHLFKDIYHTFTWYLPHSP
jgi:hypothetical protein